MDFDLIAHGIIIGVGIVALVFGIASELRESSNGYEARTGPRP